MEFQDKVLTCIDCGADFVFTAGEHRRMLEAAGFDVLALHGGTTGEPYQLGTPRLVITARRH